MRHYTEVVNIITLRNLMSAKSSLSGLLPLIAYIFRHSFVELMSLASCGQNGNFVRAIIMVAQRKNMSKTNIIRVEGTHRVYVFQVQLYLVPRFVERLPSFQMVFGRDFVQAGQQQRILGHALNGHLRCDRRK